MKKIEAIIRPFKLDEVRGALTDFGIRGLTISEVENSGWRNSALSNGHGRARTACFHSKIKVEVVVADGVSDAVSSAIADAARTGSSNDGEIFISHVEEAVRIRTRETDLLAVC